MCYYCRYLAHEKSINYDDKEYFRDNVKYQTIKSCHLALLLRLIGITIFFILFNITLVLSQSSQVQQQRDQSSSKILERNSQGRTKQKYDFFFYLFKNKHQLLSAISNQI